MEHTAPLRFTTVPGVPSRVSCSAQPDSRSGRRGDETEGGTVSARPPGGDHEEQGETGEGS